jgi:hypothetical protein
LPGDISVERKAVSFHFPADDVAARLDRGIAAAVVAWRK